MAAAKDEPGEVLPEAVAPAETKVPETYVLTKNFGPVIRGRSYFWASGTEFVLPEDGETLTLMFSYGAPLQQKKA
jgi:hypothetical protein